MGNSTVWFFISDLSNMTGLQALMNVSASGWMEIVFFTALIFTVFFLLRNTILYKSRIRILEKKIRSDSGNGQGTENLEKDGDILISSAFNTKTGNAIMLFNAVGDLEWVNDGFHHLTGYTKEEFIKLYGRNIIEISTNKEIQTLIDKAVANKESVIYISQNITMSGNPIWMHTTLTPIFGKDGKVSKLLAIDTDITHLKKAEEELNRQKAELEEQRNHAMLQKDELEKAFKKSSKHHIQLQKALWMNEKQKDELEKLVEVINKQNRDLEKANFEIKEASRMKEVFLTNTSHEIRTPLNAIMGFTNLLMSNNPNPSQLNYLQNIKSSGDNLLVVINDILDFSKIESGKITFEKIGFNLYDIIEHCLSSLNVKAIEKNQNLSWHIDQKIPKILEGDPVRLNQIITNLIGNSIKFTPANGAIKLAVELLKNENNIYQLEFSIADNGIGIPEDKLSGIFESFTQAESDTTRKYGGTGLGLAIVKQLVQLQNGKIWVESKLGQGTTFFFQLSLEAGSVDELKNESPDKKRSAQPLPDNLRILLVEDNRINQQLALDTLKQWNKTFTIDLAENGREAIEKIKQNNYHIILMDIQMPEMDGREATAYIRKKMPPPKCDIPIIAMTAHALKDERQKCLDLGMNDYVSKPFDPNELYNKILVCSPKEAIPAPQVPQESKPEEVNVHFSENFRQRIDQLKIIDLTQLIKIYKNDEEKIKKILLLYLESTTQEINTLKESYNTENWQGMMSKAHTLKTKMNYLGIKGLAEAARLIENFSKEQREPDKISKLIEILEDDWKGVQGEISLLIL